MKFLLIIMVMILVIQITQVINLLMNGPKAKVNTYPRSKKSGIKKKKDNRYSGLTKEDYIKRALPISTAAFLICFILARSFLLALVVASFGLYYPVYKMKKGERKRKELLNDQFREALHAISNSLKTGSSLPVALERSVEDLSDIYRHHMEKPIIEELSYVIQDMRFGKSIEEALEAFDKRCDLEDISSFVNAAVITEKTGGNLTEVMMNVNSIIGDKIEIRREINTLTAAKRSEANVLSVVPIVLVILLSVFSPKYMEPMYSTLLGKAMMVLGLVLLILNYIIGKKVINIDI